MTMPDERYRAIQMAGKLLEDLAYYKERTPRVPKEVRDRARGILRHFPSDWDLDRLAALGPAVICKQMEPLHKMVMSYSETVDQEDQSNDD